MSHTTLKQKRALKAGGHRNKYGAVRTEYNGVTYASKAEAARAAALDLLKAGGEVVSIERQPRYALGCPENVYVADFLVRDRHGKVWTEDVKGVETSKFRRDMKLWRVYGPHPLHIIRNARTVKIVVPNTATKGER